MNSIVPELTFDPSGKLSDDQKKILAFFEYLNKVAISERTLGAETQPIQALLVNIEKSNLGQKDKNLLNSILEGVSESESPTKFLNSESSKTKPKISLWDCIHLYLEFKRMKVQRAKTLDGRISDTAYYKTLGEQYCMDKSTVRRHCKRGKKYLSLWNQFCAEWESA